MISDLWAKERVNRSMTVVRIVWVALIATIFVYGFLLSRTTQLSVDWMEIFNKPLFLPFALFGMSTFALSFFIPKMLGPAMVRSAQSHDWTEASLRGAMVKGRRLYPDADIPKLLALSGMDLQIVRATNAYFMSKIFQWIAIDISAAMGFSLASTTKSLAVFFPFATLALLGLFMTPPSLREWRRLAETGGR